jgi:hypothetical protein
MGSRIPIFGLIHKLNVVRKTDADDGAGNIVPEGAENILYSSWPARVTNLEGDKDEQKGHGFDSAKNRMVIMKHAPKVQRNDFIRLPWGVPPNNVTPMGLADGTPPIGIVTTPGATFPVITFTWDEALSIWNDDQGGSVTLQNTGGFWHFQNSEDALDLTLGAVATTNPFGHYLWGEQAGYSINQASSTKDYRVVWENTKIDDFGRMHHTSLVIELEDEDA